MYGGVKLVRLVVGLSLEKKWTINVQNGSPMCLSRVPESWYR